MPFERPSLREILTRVAADVESRLTKQQIRRSNAKVYERVLAGASHEIHAHIDWLQKQLFFQTAETDFLDRWASVFGIYRTPATSAAGTAQLTFSADPVDVPQGTVLQSDAGNQYQTTDSPSPSGVVAVEALLAGADGNLVNGDTLQFVSPVAGVDSAATSLGISGGTDAETDEELRTRLLERARQTPCGGAAHDYVAWAKDGPGVATARGVAGTGSARVCAAPGPVRVYLVCHDLPDIIPTAEKIAEVQAKLDYERPVTAITTALAPATQAVNIRISSLTPSTTAVRSAVEKALADLFISEAEPGGLMYLSHIRAAISNAAGEIDSTVVSPSANIQAPTNTLLTLGTITWS